jgi:3-oxoacyl-[acyl-carrier-protein] synthase II
MKKAKLRRVGITGMGIGSPAGHTLEDNFSACWIGKNCFSPITRYETAGSSVRFSGECPEPDTRTLPDRKVQKILRRKDVISLITTLTAAKSASLFPNAADPERCGMYVGASSTQIGDLTPYFMLVEGCADLKSGTFDSARFGQELLSLVNPLVVLQTLMNNGLCFGTMTLDFRGVNANFMDFQIAGLRAIGEAFRSLSYDRADVAISGGIAGPVEPFQLAEGVSKGYLANTSAPQTNPSLVIKPWDRTRCGTILSEGSAYIVLEEKNHATGRGLPFHATITGFGLASDGQLNFMDSMESPGLLQAMRLALQDADLDPQDICAIIGHGNGSLQGDAVELSAYETFFAGKQTETPLTSVKSIIGDMCEAQGPMSVCIAVESLRKGEIPPTFNVSDFERKKCGLTVSNKPQKIAQGPIMITGRSFLGLCAALIVSPI